jgi:hypothetical protein
MIPQLGLFMQPLNDRIRDSRRQNVLIPILEDQDARLSSIGALMAAAMISNQPQQFRFSRLIWWFLRDGEIDVADIYELDDAMREIITSAPQVKTAEDLSHLEQFFVVSDWNGNNVILANRDDGKSCG